MSRNNTILVAIVVAVVAIGAVFAVVYSEDLATMLRLVDGREYFDSTWTDLQYGNTETIAGGKIYPVSGGCLAEPGDEPDVYMPPSHTSESYPNPPFNSQLAKYDWQNGCEPIRIVLDDILPGEYDIEFIVMYATSGEEPQWEPIDLKTLGAGDSVRIEDEGRDHDETWWRVNTDAVGASGNIGQKLSLRFNAGDTLEIEAPHGSVSFAGVKVKGFPDESPVNMTLTKTNIFPEKKIDPAAGGMDSVAVFGVDVAVEGTPTDATFADIYGWDNFNGEIDYDECIDALYISDVQGNDIGANFEKGDMDGDGYDDTILYRDWAKDGRGANIYFAFKMTDIDPPGETTCSQALYGSRINNFAGITAKELNEDDSGYPLSDFTTWNWVWDTDYSDIINFPGQLENPEATITKSVAKVGGGSIYQGDTVEYVLTMTNTGNVELTNAVILDDYDETYLEGITTGDTKCEGLTPSGQICLDMGNLGVGLSKTVSYRATVMADVPIGQSVNNLAICSAIEFPQPNACVDQANFQLGLDQVEEPHAILNKSVNESQYYLPGDTITYTLTLENDGDQDLTSVKVNDFYDTAYLENPVVTVGTACLEEEHTDHVCFDVGALAQGDSAILAYTAQIKADTPNQTEIINNAKCESNEYPSGLHSPTACHAEAIFIVKDQIQPVEKPHANLTKEVTNLSARSATTQDVYNVGDTVEYTLVVTNDGNDTLTNMKVIDDYDEIYLDEDSVQIVEGYGTPCWEQAPGTICFQVDTMEPSTEPGQVIEQVILKYTAKIKSNAAGANVPNVATCKSDQYPGGGGLTDLCEARAQFPVEGISPQQLFELYVSERVDKVTAKPADRLNYVTIGGNKGPGDADHVLFLTSLLVPGPQVVQETAELLPAGSTIQQVEQVLQEQLGIVQAGGIVDVHTSVLGPGIVDPGDLKPYTNLPGDDIVTGLELPASPVPGVPQYKLDLDHDGIIDTIVHIVDASWAAEFERNEDIFTNVRASLAPGNYSINNTGIVIRPDVDVTKRIVLMDQVTTTVSVEGSVEPAPEITVVKTVTDNDETNVTANLAVAGETLTYTITYTNLDDPLGTANGGIAREAWIEDDYDEAYMQIVDAAGAEDSGNGLFWYLGEVAYGESVTKTFTARIASEIPSEGISFDNVVAAGAKGLEPVSAIVTTTIPAEDKSPEPYVIPRKDLVDVNGGAVEPGDVLEYKVVIENTGNTAALEVVGEDELSPYVENLEVVSVSDQIIDNSIDNKVLLEIPRLEAQQKVEVVYRVQVISGVADQTTIINDVVIEAPKDEDGTTTLTPTAPGRTSGTSAAGRVGSAFTGPGTASAAAAQIAGVQTVAQAAETGGNTLIIAIVTAALALGAGIGVLYLRKQLVAS